MLYSLERAKRGAPAALVDAFVIRSFRAPRQRGKTAPARRAQVVNATAAAHPRSDGLHLEEAHASQHAIRREGVTDGFHLPGLG